MTEKKSLIGTNGTDPNTLNGEGGKDDYGNYLSAINTHQMEFILSIKQVILGSTLSHLLARGLFLKGEFLSSLVNNHWMISL